MPHVNDCVHQVLLDSLGLTEGQINDLVYAKLEELLGSPGGRGNVMDLWRVYFDLQGIPAGQHNDRMVAWLKAQGAVGDSYNDLWYYYWCVMGGAPPAPEGIYDTFTDVDGTEILNHTPDVGGPWVGVTLQNRPPIPANVTIQGNTLESSTDHEGVLFDFGEADVQIEFDFQLVTQGACGCIMRSSGFGYGLMFRIYDGFSGNIRLDSYTFGARTQLTTGSFIVGTSPHHALVTLNGPNVILSIDDGEIINWSTTDHQAVTGHGPYFDQRVSSRADKIDNFSCIALP